MGIGEILMIAVVGLVIFGPDRLPKVAMQAAQLLRTLREQANAAKESLVQAADIDEQTLRDIRDLDPRRALRDIVSPIDDARRAANQALRDANDAVHGQAADPASPTAAPAPELPRPAGVDPRDIS